MGSSSKSKEFKKSLEYREKNKRIEVTDTKSKPRPNQRPNQSSKQRPNKSPNQKARTTSHAKAKKKKKNKTLIVGTSTILAAIAGMSAYSYLNNNQEKVNYNDWLETVGLEDTVKNTGVKPEIVEKLCRLKDEISEENIKNISNYRLIEIYKEAHDAEIEAIHSKIRLFVGDNKTIEVYSYKEGKKTIDVNGKTIYENGQIPIQLLQAIDAAASIDKKMEYENINRVNEINIIRSSIDEVMDLISDRCYVNKGGRLVCDEAPIIKDGVIDEEAQKFMKKKYTTYVYDMYGELSPVILDGVYNEEYAEYDNPYISIDEYLENAINLEIEEDDELDR